MRRARLLIPAFLAFTLAACSSQQTSYYSTTQPQTAQVEERGLFTGDGPFARKGTPGYAQPAYAQALPQQPYTAQSWPQQNQQPRVQQAYNAQQPAAAQGQVVEQRYGPNSYVMQYQPPPQAAGGPYAPAPYGYPNPAAYRPSPVY